MLPQTRSALAEFQGKRKGKGGGTGTMDRKGNGGVVPIFVCLFLFISAFSGLCGLNEIDCFFNFRYQCS